MKERKTRPGKYLRMDRLDSYRCNKLLIDARGSQDAWRHAVERALELKQIGTEDGHAAWVFILTAIETLSRT